MRTGKLWIWLAAFGLGVLASPGPGEGTHEVDHRYLVIGYLQDEQGQPLRRAPVRATRERTGLSYEAATEDNGFYLLVIHLHDDDVGDALRVTAAGATVRVEARFAPWEGRRHRGTRIDFQRGKGRNARSCSFRRWPTI
ncbi:MAG: carboxypeptidase regulatory-like domain-containing protein [Candidatus Rokubacteria bacterium]|nr:carboxypeptidase regulatory-like domain-containing protein [Candidatus Rokubacteria bacterium]MBI3108160.1 carboxypeptidase regulatory-like domain-containing protein [Candidatus Rokubacteria bacterium]